MSTERVIVHEKVAANFAEFKKAVAEFAPEHKQAACLINKAGVDKNQRLLNDAISKGATIVYGDPMNSQETRMRPVVVRGTTKEMELFLHGVLWTNS